MATGIAGSGIGLMGGVAAGGAAIAAVAGGLYLAGVIGPGPDPAPAPETVTPVVAPAETPEPAVDPVVAATSEPAVTPAPATTPEPEPAPMPASEPVEAQAPVSEPVQEPTTEVADDPAPEPADPAPTVAADTTPEPTAPQTAETTPTEPTSEQVAALAPEPKPTQTPSAEAEPTPPTVEATPEPVTPEPVLPLLEAPGFDLVRMALDGETIIAGTGTPDSKVTIFLDEVEQDSLTIDDSGKFVSFLFLAPSDAARVLTLNAALGGETIWSRDQIILAPTPRATPPVVASLPEEAPAPTPEPTQSDSQTQDEPAQTPDAVAETTPTARPEQIAAAPEPEPAVQSPTSEQVADAPASDPASTTQPTPVQADEAPAEEAPVAVATLPQQADEAPAEEAPVAVATLPQQADEAPAEEATPEQAAPKAPEQVVAEAPAEPTAPPAQPEAAPETSSVDPAQPSVVDPTPVTILRATSDGVEVLQTGSAAPPDVMDEIALDAISYSDAGAVQLSGRASVASVVRIYLDNQAIAELIADDAGRWRTVLEGIEPGVYTLRLDEVDALGKVTSRIETPFKREAPAALAAIQADRLPNAPLISAVTVQKGDTLWAISRDRYGEGVLYVRVFEANRDRIRNPDLIYPGQVFSIPN